ncbi:MAG: hypothetical protein ACRDSK_13615 [Actinophytocola sp.]|uniref:hypothetical protein n=1 Tax=Actinophytocola sp. TaxID=1872138 RepID=UPI003D6B40B6
MATVSHLVDTPDTNASPNTSAAFTPAVGDLLVVGVVASATQDIGTATISAGTGVTSFTHIARARFGGNAHVLNVFVANQLVTTAASATVTWDDDLDASTGTVIMVERIAGMTKTGATAVRQSAIDENRTTGTIGVTFASACLTGNPTIGFAGLQGIAVNAAVPPSGWTELADTGYGTPTTGGESCGRDSGFSGTTVTWTSDAGTDDAAMVVEFDASGAGNPVALDGTGTAAGSAVGSLSNSRAVTGAASAASSASGTVAAARALSGSTDAAAGATGAASVARPLTGSASSASHATGELSIGGLVALDGSAASAASAGGAVGVTRPLAGTAAAAAALQGSAGVTRPLAGTAASAASASGDLSVATDVQLIGTGPVAGHAAAALELQRPVTATLTAVAAATGVLTMARLLQSAAPAAAALTADLATQRPVTGAGSAATHAAADLTVTAAAIDTTLTSRSGHGTDLEGRAGWATTLATRSQPPSR